jgi:hypothetical protein
MTLWLATYSDPKSATGVGSSIIFTEDLPVFAARYADVEFRIYSRDNDVILTPTLIAACSGNSDSI